jgi:chromate transporter
VEAPEAGKIIPDSATGPSTLKEIALSFLRLGTTAFGGPAAHIAMMEDEFVRRRRWLSREQFLDMLGATNLIPGPNSTEMAIHIGHQRAGWKGLVTGGVCFIVPAMAIVMAAAWAYVHFGSLPPVQGIMYGIKPVIIAIVLQALWRLFPSAIKNLFLGVIGLLATVAALLGLNVLIVLFGAGVITALTSRVNRSRSDRPLAAIPGIMAVLKAAGAAAPAVAFSLMGLFLFFLKVGAVLYGSGYVLLAFLQADLVDRLHWLTQ